MILSGHAFFVPSICPYNQLPLLPIQTPGLINQHHRNIITNCVHQSALFTDKAICRLGEPDRPFALRADQDIK